MKSELSISEVINLAQEKGFKLDLIEGDFTVGSLPLYDFYYVKPDMDAISIEEDYKNSRLGYFKDILKGESELTQEQKKEIASQLGELKAALERNDPGRIKIKKFTLTGDEKGIQDLSQNTAVDQVNIIEEKQKSPSNSPSSTLQPLQHKPEQLNKKQSSLIKENFIATLFNSLISKVNAIQTFPSVPRYGVSQTQSSSITGERETTQWMKWDWKSFNSTQTYEHALRYENSDGKTYLNNGTTLYPGCWPVITYAATSWPSTSRPYVDTRASGDGVYCDTAELEFTIGMFQAYVVSPNTWYHTYIRSTNGNASNDRFKLMGEIGHQAPPICSLGQEVWCSSYPDITVDLAQAWNSEVPGTKWWELGVRFCENNRAGSYGRCLDFAPGTYDLTEYNFNDILTTIRMPKGIQWKVTVYENVNPSTNQCYGNGWIFTSNAERYDINLYEGGLNFNDKASCAIVQFN